MSARKAPSTFFVALLLSLGAPVIGQEDLVFRPLPPCRVIDSRIGLGIAGPLQPNTTWAVTFGGTCGVPGPTTDGGVESNRAVAVAVNLVAIQPAGNGHLRAWPANQAMPNASVLNYAAAQSMGNLNLANGLILPLCDEQTLDPCFTGDLHFRAFFASTHLVADVTGYFTKPVLSGAVRYGTAGIDSFLCNSVDVPGVRFGLSERIVPWHDAAAACPTGSWVCSQAERGGSICDTTRPDDSCDALQCDGQCVDHPANAHFGWVAEPGATEVLATTISETPEAVYQTAVCRMRPVWCCSRF